MYKFTNQKKISILPLFNWQISITAISTSDSWFRLFSSISSWFSRSVRKAQLKCNVDFYSSLVLLWGQNIAPFVSWISVVTANPSLERNSVIVAGKICVELVNYRYSFVQLLYSLTLQEIQQVYVPIRSLMWRLLRDHDVVKERQTCRRN
jgi:hypothetical protein